MNKNWTNEEIEYLKNNCSERPVRFIANKLNKSINAVMIKRERLGLPSYSKSNYKYISARKLGKILNKDKSTIIYWINKYNDFPIDNSNKAKTNSKAIVFEDILPWLEKHQNLFLGYEIEPYSLGLEPQWLKDKRLLDKDKKRKTIKPYTTKECKDILKYYFLGYNYNEIAQLFNRTSIAIEHKINSLKKRSDYFDLEEL